MTGKSALLFLFLILACAFFAVSALAEEEDRKTQATRAPAGAAAPAATQPAASPDTRPPIPLLQYGFEERIRTEDWNNIIDYSGRSDDELHQIRFRTRLWVQVPLASPDIDFYLKLNGEFKKVTVPDTRLNMDEVVFESLYLDFKKTFIPGVSLRVGRQDLMRGEGFILFDGSSGDGSRTAYFNAVDLAYSRKQSKLELIGILDPRQDRFLPVIHRQSSNLNEWDELAVGLYYTDRNHPKTDVDAYYFYKKEINDHRAPTDAQYQSDRHISTLGARVVRRLPEGFSLTGEFAAQWGRQRPNPALSMPAADIRAWGGYLYAKKQFASKWKPYLLGGWWGLSGDDPSTTGRIEGFDPIFSRWPKWSELYIYSLVPERGVAYWTNQKMLQAEAGFAPWKPVALRATFYYQDAFQPYTLGSLKTFGTGTRRGQNIQLRMDYSLNKNLKGHVLWERFDPGDFYRVQNGGFFFRAEIMYAFKGSIGTLARK